MKLFDKQGTPVEVPEEQVPTALQSGDLGLPAGTAVPVRLADGRVGSVPVEHAPAAFAQGAQPVSATDFHKAALDKRYGGVSGEIAAGLEGAARGASLGATDAAARAAGGLFGGAEGEDAVRRHLEAVQAANPNLSTAAELAGAVAPAFLSEGASAVGEAGEGASLLSRAARLVSAPSEAVTGLGNLVERGVGKLVGTEGTGLATKVLQRAAALGARGAAEGAIYGGAQAADESILGDTELAGQKLLGAMGHGALLGGLGGAGLGASGELGRAVLGRASTAVATLAEGQAFRALNPERRFVKLADKIEGGAEGVGRRLLEDGVMAAGDGIDEIAPKVAAKRTEWGAKVGEILQQADDAGFEGPKVASVFDAIAKDTLPRLEALPSLNAGAISKVRGLAEDIAGHAGIPTAEAAEAAGMTKAQRLAMLDDARLSFKQAHELRARIDDAIKWTTNPLAPVNETTEALKGIRAALEKEIETAGDTASKRLGGTFLEDYKEAKLAYRQYAVADQAAENAVAARRANRVGSPSDYGVGLAGLAGGLASGNPLHALLGVAGGFAHHIVRERGNALAAVALDRVSVIAGAQRAAAAVDREVERGISRIAGSTERVPPRTRDTSLTTYKARATAVRSALADVEGHAQAIDRAAGPLTTHAPNVANAFQRAAIRATTFLAKALPQDSQPPGIVHEEPFEPSDMEKQAFSEKYDAVNDPPLVLAHVHDGTVTPNEVAALKAVHADWYAQMAQSLTAELSASRATIPYERQVAISLFLERPVAPTLEQPLVAMFQQNAQANQAAAAAAGAGKGGPKKGSAPKRAIHSSSKLGLTGLNKELGV